MNKSRLYYIILNIVNRAEFKLLVLGLLAITAVGSLCVGSRANRKFLTVAFLNIGQGDAIFIEAPSGNQMLVDGGPGGSIARELSAVLPFYDRSLDVVLATHPDADHTSGLNEVLEKYRVSLFVEPGVAGETATYRALEKAVTDKKITKLEARRGMVFDLGSGVSFEILFPVNDPRGLETNVASIVGRLVYGENEFLLTGDSPVNIEHYLVTQGGLKSDVLKAGHHGSRTSTSPEFVAAVSPEYAVISAGRNNKYGHPHQEVLDILQSAGVKILRTDEQGRIIFKSDGANIKLKK